MTHEQSPASPLVQEIRFRSQTCSNFPQQTNCEKEYQGHHEFWCDGCLFRLLLAEYETLQHDAERHLIRANEEIARRERAEIAYTQSEQKRLVLTDRAEAAEARAEAAEARLAQPARTGCDDCLDARKAAEARAEAAERTVTSIATMLGWGNVPPQHVLENEIRTLKAAALASPVTDAAERSPVLDFQTWAERYTQDRGKPLTQDEYFLAQAAFFSAHPGQGPTSSVMTDAAEPQKEHDLGLLGTSPS